METSTAPPAESGTRLVRSPDEWSVVSSLLALSTTCLLLLLLRLEWRKKEFLKNFAGTKYRFLDVLGDSADVPVQRMRNMGLSPGIGMLQSVMGFCHLYGQEGIFCINTFYKYFVVATKAEVIEQMIGGMKMLDKGWTYDFLHPWLGTGMLTSPGKKWRTRRKLLMPCFHTDILRDYLPVFNQKCAILMNLMRKETEKEFTDIVLPVILCSLDIICETSFGVNISAQENEDSVFVISTSNVATLMYERMINYKYWLPWYWLLKPGRKLKKNLKNMKDFCRSVIQEKKEQFLKGDIDTSKKYKSVMDLLIEHHVKFKTLNENDILEEVLTFATAGHDAMAISIIWALYMIGLHQDVQEKVHEELDHIFGKDLNRPATVDDLRDMQYLECVIKESERIYTPAPLISRETDKDVTICGRRIPKGTTCILFFHMLHRDESVFPDPEKFDPVRFSSENTAKRHPFAFTPFSAGPRTCLGQVFALMEQKVLLSTFLRHYRIESLDPRDKIHPLPSVVLRPSGPIRIKIRSRIKSI